MQHLSSNPNVLLTCAGRRNYLVHYFRNAIEPESQVYATDASATAPALQAVDRCFVVPRIDAPDYIDQLLHICADNHIGMLVSLNDLELPLLARHRAQFLDIGVVPVISTPDVIDTCFDKYATVQFLQEHDLLTPRTFLSLEQVRLALNTGEVQFPLVVKPRWGTASISVEYVTEEEMLELAYQLVHKRLRQTILATVSDGRSEEAVIIQECLQGQEYGLDIVNNLDGNNITTFVKKKLAMRAGETDKSMTTANPVLKRLGRQLGECLGHVGMLDCDVFEQDNQYYVLEMNPRFGGGYPFSHMAGANVPAALIAWLRGKDADPGWLAVETGVIAAKHDCMMRIA
jgi:carbamoyl-phosphate synthase large subunit